jgi:hypothetical protein
MVSDEMLTRIRDLVRRSRYRLSLHAERERDADRIRMSELEEALRSEGLELLEDYPEDPRGHSHLVLGLTRAGQAIHAVCAVHEGVLVIVTVYRPDPKLWQDYRVRKEKT